MGMSDLIGWTAYNINSGQYSQQEAEGFGQRGLFDLFGIFDIAMPIGIAASIR